MDTQKNQTLFNKRTSTWFRWIAAVMVILSHYAEWWSWFYEEKGTGEMIRYGLSRLGPYGVAIFFLFSGYGLTKSAGEKRIGQSYILKRIITLYFPYLIVVILIETLSGSSLEDLSDIWFGSDFWYMTVIFVLYLAFMAAWFLFQNRHIRAVLMAAFVYWYSNGLYQRGEFDFWYISNIAFVIGVWLALYENEILKVNIIFRYFLTLIFGVSSGYAVYFAISVVRMPEFAWVETTDEIHCRILAVTIFTMFVACFASVWKYYDPLGCFLGKYSLYFYLLHTFLFMWTVNYFNCDIKLRFAVATALILVMAVALGMPITNLTDIFYRKIQHLVDFKQKKG